MTKEIVVIQGSPRENGSTRFLSSIMVQAIRDANVNISEIDATKLKFKFPGCTGCGKCHESDFFTCSVDDELAHTVATLIDYDIITIVTPTYWMSYPSQLKMFIDRMGSLMKFDESGGIQTPLAGKVLAILATGNAGMENNMDLLKGQLNSMADMLSCQFYSCMFPNTPMEISVLKNNQSAIEKAKEFGRLLSTPR